MFLFQIGDPAKTAWEINDRGNKVWFTYEHSPSIFPVKETRFYKPKLHTKNFMNPEEDDEENEKSIWKFEKITTRWFYFIKHIIILFILWCSIHRSCYEHNIPNNFRACVWQNLYRNASNLKLKYTYVVFFVLFKGHFELFWFDSECPFEVKKVLLKL